MGKGIRGDTCSPDSFGRGERKGNKKERIDQLIFLAGKSTGIRLINVEKKRVGYRIALSRLRDGKSLLQLVAGPEKKRGRGRARLISFLGVESSGTWKVWGGDVEGLPDGEGRKEKRDSLNAALNISAKR